VLNEPIAAIEITPNSEPRASVIWLHGLGADGHDFEAIVPQLKLSSKLGVRFVFPHAPYRPVTLNGGVSMRAWFDIPNLDVLSPHDKKGLCEAQNTLEQLITTEIERGIPSHRIILAGFSQGGTVVLHTGLAFSQPLAGILALSTFLPSTTDTHWKINNANIKTPLFMAHGSQDTLVQLKYGQLTRDTLQKKGCRIDWHEYPMPHAVCPEEINDIGQWISARLRND